MPSSVLVPLDGSYLAEEALPVAIDLALRWREPLLLAGVHRVPGFMFTPETGIGGFPAFDEETRRQLENYLKATVDRLSVHAGLEVSYVRLEGDVVDALAHQANASEVRVVVMTTHGRGGASRVFLGSVADGLVRHVRCPVLLMTPGLARHAAPSPDAPWRVVVPLDGTALSESILDRVLALYPARDIALNLVSVLGLPLLGVTPVAATAGRAGLVEAEAAAAQDYLRSVADRLRGHGLQVETKVVFDEQVAHAIVAHAEASRADLVAIATRGRSGPRRMLFGSVADKVLRTAGRPVLIWNPMPGASSQLLEAGQDDHSMAATAAGGIHA
jgi:nucleotide-binding universal stress UspA family protein